MCHQPAQVKENRPGVDTKPKRKKKKKKEKKRKLMPAPAKTPNAGCAPSSQCCHAVNYVIDVGAGWQVKKENRKSLL
jgi:hypothetical protein